MFTVKLQLISDNNQNQATSSSGYVVAPSLVGVSMLRGIQAIIDLCHHDEFWNHGTTEKMVPPNKPYKQP